MRLDFDPLALYIFISHETRGTMSVNHVSNIVAFIYLKNVQRYSVWLAFPLHITYTTTVVFLCHFYYILFWMKENSVANSN